MKKTSVELKFFSSRKTPISKIELHLSTTDKKFASGFGGIAVGFMLALVHLISIPVDNTSVNPARSMGVAVFVGGQATSQLWLFFVAPIIGGVIGAFAYKYISENK